jgi:hypothetical protein
MNTNKELIKSVNQLANAVGKQQKSKKEKKKKNKNKGSGQYSVTARRNFVMRMPTGDDEKKLLALFRNGFNRKGFGAKLLDPFPVPTAPYSQKCRLTLASDASGNLNHLLFGHPLIGIMSMLGTIPSSDMVGYSSNGYVQAPTNVVNMSRIATSWRVVTSTWAIRNLQNYQTITGKLIAGMVAGTDTRVLSAEQLEGVTTNRNVIAQALTGLNLSANNGNTGSLVEELPDALTIDACDMIGKTLYLNGRPINYEGFAFKPAAISYSVNDADSARMGENFVEVTATGLISQAGVNVISTNGYPVYAIYGTGYPVSTNVLDLELIIHYEVVPALRSTSNQINVAACPVPSVVEAVGGPGIMDRIMNLLTRDEMIAIAQVGAATLGQAVMGDTASLQELVRVIGMR